MLARVKLKGIDGSPHKRWIMRFNSMQHEEPYQGLTCHEGERKLSVLTPRGLNVNTGGAWLSSARVVRCCVKSRNERNPRALFNSSKQTAGEKSEEGEDDVKSACPLRPGLHTCYNGQHKEMQRGDPKPTSKNWSQFRLQAETRLHEGGIASNRRSAIRR